MVKKVRFTIDAQGEVHLDVQGAVGGECDALTQPFEAKLGLVAAKERKDSYFATEQTDLQQTTQGDTP